jgi:hypothetical protein
MLIRSLATAILLLGESAVYAQALATIEYARLLQRKVAGLFR